MEGAHTWAITASRKIKQVGQRKKRLIQKALMSNILNQNKYCTYNDMVRRIAIGLIVEKRLHLP
jgi:ribosomal protein S3AE